jgi:hypothetical protein
MEPMITIARLKPCTGYGTFELGYGTAKSTSTMEKR